ncbi:hypothetical protein Pcinc_024244 [Petrolisthes cinctipes]|uniref:Uncharacterized protein n=1 Tax=Petrolisthes cinctipes TaxID=88211 RepID=A0AAE1KFL1_PETCI|nr:hypothetical protein Pcinc_024244 [Petrolisthes cinctipes]
MLLTLNIPLSSHLLPPPLLFYSYLQVADSEGGAEGSEVRARGASRERISRSKQGKCQQEQAGNMSAGTGREHVSRNRQGTCQQGNILGGTDKEYISNKNNNSSSSSSMRSENGLTSP